MSTTSQMLGGSRGNENSNNDARSQTTESYMRNHSDYGSEEEGEEDDPEEDQSEEQNSESKQ